jgi:large subunit ribosomal protein L5
MSTATETETTTGPRLKQKYNDEVKGALEERSRPAQRHAGAEDGKDRHQHGRRPGPQQPSLLEGAVKDLTRISGQKPVITKSRDSIAGFKLREGQSIGCKVTLRGDRMWEFFDRLVSVAIPRIRDFRGLPATSWDGRGNYTFGLDGAGRVPGDRLRQDRRTAGMDITIVTTAATNEQGKALLDAFGFPSSGRPTRRHQKRSSVADLRSAARRKPAKK